MIKPLRGTVWQEYYMQVHTGTKSRKCTHKRTLNTKLHGKPELFLLRESHLLKHLQLIGLE